MRKLLLLIALSILPIIFVEAQKVDSIKIEQKGDFIQIRFKILNSTANQLYRVRVLCAINGGLNTEIKSVSGDTGDNVVGGKAEYFVLWDVLKDVDELKSAEFIVRAELVKDLSMIQPIGGKSLELTNKWAKKGANIMLAADLPGPKLGFRIGYMRSIGATLQYVVGQSVVNDPGGNPAFSSYDPPKLNAISVGLTKRIVSNNAFQMHAMLGVKRSHIIFYSTLASVNPLQEQKVDGFEGGFIMDVKNIAFSLVITHFDPGKVEKNHPNSYSVSPLNYISASVGVRF